MSCKRAPGEGEERLRLAPFSDSFTDRVVGRGLEKHPYVVDRNQDDQHDDPYLRHLRCRHVPAGMLMESRASCWIVVPAPGATSFSNQRFAGAVCAPARFVSSVVVL